MATISSTLLVDKEKNRVVFAESDKDFVDVLFSFLTLPMGTVIRLLDKQSSVGCMDKLYESVENLNTKYFETEACRTMLLEPRSTAEILCHDLMINADNLDSLRIYRCPLFDCFTKTHPHFSSICGARCCCGRKMDKVFDWWHQPEANEKDGVFLKGAAKFVISDDLSIAPATITATLSLLRKLGIKDAEILEKRTVDVSRDKVLSLLKMLLQSKTPLTDVFLQAPDSINRNGEEHGPAETVQRKLESENESAQVKTINVKLLHDKKTNKVVNAEAREDFVDLLFSFLTFPLGSIVKLLQEHSSIACVGNLYKSVEVLDADTDFIKSEDFKNMLLAPVLSPYFNCDNQLLRIEENLSRFCTVLGCKTCWNEGQETCKHKISDVELTEINPKLPGSGTEDGGGYAKRSSRFMVSSGIVIRPLSAVSGIDIIRELKAPVGSLTETEVTLTQAKAMNLLRACLVSRAALDSLLPSKKQHRKSY